MRFIVVSLVFAFLGIGLAFIRRLRGWRYFIISFVVAVGGFLAVLWPELPLGATLATPEGPLAVFIYHLVPFLILFYLPLTAGYFVTRAVRRRFFHYARMI
jgi:hypothetical protein